MIQTDEKSQAESRDYVLNRPLLKPSTTLAVPILVALGIVMLGVVSGIIISNVFEHYVVALGIHKFWVITGVAALTLCCGLKLILILCIRCYQHYAPECVRRSCLCKPTCSEYAIIVIKKYCLVKALVLIYIRLFKTCTGKIYKIDYPNKK